MWHLAPLLFVLLSSPTQAQTPAPRDGADLCRGEDECLRVLRGRASRSGDVLRLKLATGETKTYRGDRKACDGDGDGSKCLVFELAGYRSDIEAYVVSFTYQDGGGAVVLSARTGHEVGLAGVPTFSPDGRWFVCVADSDYPVDEYDVGVWAATPTGATVAFRYKAKPNSAEEWSLVGWRGSDRIGLRLLRAGAPEASPELVLTPQGWRLDRKAEGGK
jgi:hypothetical protein